jgi:class 3 adenylate cyclase
MSKAVMDKLLEKGDAVLGGTGREVSVLFSDIRGFTALTERLGARQTVALLNEYFTDMVDVVFAHSGILDKYIGDMIMAVFGSVLTSEDDADNAVTVGSRMMVALRELNARRLAAGHDPIRIGVGISTGHVVAGNIGSPKRLEFTVIGDRVNLAERLQNANKYYGTSVLDTREGHADPDSHLRSTGPPHGRELPQPRRGRFRLQTGSRPLPQASLVPGRGMLLRGVDGLPRRPSLAPVPGALRNLQHGVAARRLGRRVGRPHDVVPAQAGDPSRGSRFPPARE